MGIFSWHGSLGQYWPDQLSIGPSLSLKCKAGKEMSMKVSELEIIHMVLTPNTHLKVDLLDKQDQLKICTFLLL